MKRTAFAIIFVLATSTAFAQKAGQKPETATTQAAAVTLEQRAEAITASMDKHLLLTPEQRSKIKEINLSSMQFAEKAKSKHKNAPQRLIQQMDMINQTRLSQIKDVLTPLQFEKYQQRREEKMGVPPEVQSKPVTPGQKQLHQDSL